MEPHEQRVVTERDELNQKLVKLTAFVNGQSPIYAGLPDAEKIRLNRQLTYMTEYSNVLDERIADWGPLPSERPELVSDADIALIHCGLLIPNEKAIHSMSREIRKWRGVPDPDLI